MKISVVTLIIAFMVGCNCIPVDTGKRLGNITVVTSQEAQELVEDHPRYNPEEGDDEETKEDKARLKEQKQAELEQLEAAGQQLLDELDEAE